MACAYVIWAAGQTCISSTTPRTVQCVASAQIAHQAGRMSLLHQAHDEHSLEHEGFLTLRTIDHHWQELRDGQMAAIGGSGAAAEATS